MAWITDSKPPKQMKPAERPNLPLFVDSGGFASLFEGSRFIDKGDYAIIETRDGDLIEPQEVAQLVGDIYRNESLAGEVFFIHGGLRLGSKG